MSVRVVRLGTARIPDEGLRIGTVRRPPRGVRRERLAPDDWYDLWLPQLAPSAELFRKGREADTPAKWRAFVRGYESEMKAPDNARLVALLAAFSHRVDFSVGCYCEEESHCHRGVLRRLLEAAGAKTA